MLSNTDIDVNTILLPPSPTILSNKASGFSKKSTQEISMSKTDKSTKPMQKLTFSKFIKNNFKKKNKNFKRSKKGSNIGANNSY